MLPLGNQNNNMEMEFCPPADSLKVLSGQKSGEDNSFFSAKPQLMNRDMIHQPQQTQLPMPLSLRKNADLDSDCETLVIPDQDHEGGFFGASLRKGPFMKV